MSHRHLERFSATKRTIDHTNLESPPYIKARNKQTLTGASVTVMSRIVCYKTRSSKLTLVIRSLQSY